MMIKTLLPLLISSIGICQGFIHKSNVHQRYAGIPSQTTFFAQRQIPDPAIDVEYEELPKRKPVQKRKEDMTMIEMILEARPDSGPVPFFDKSTDRYIDCRVALELPLDGEMYTIGVPYHTPVGILTKSRDGRIEYIDPDDEKSTSVIEFMATELGKEVGEDYKFKRTPRVLTVEGDLDILTSGWKKALATETFDPEEALDESDNGLEFFDKFMKKEFGEEYDRTKIGGPSGKEIMELQEELKHLFEMEDMGEIPDDIESLEKMMKQMDEELFKVAKESEVDENPGALHLLTFDFKDQKGMSLVQYLKPQVLVGKVDLGEDDDDPNTIYLLTRKEEPIVMPKLEARIEAILEDDDDEDEDIEFDDDVYA